MSIVSRLSFQHLVYLEALVLEKHVTRAGDRVGIGQPAMSASLAKLRKLFHDPLLMKTSGGMEPTPRAIELARRAREIIDLAEGRGGSEADFDVTTTPSRFRVMASDGIARLLLPKLLERAQREAPNMRFTVQPGDVRRTSEYLRDGDFDLVLAFLRTPPADLHQSILYPQRLMCIARRGHPAINGRLTQATFLELNHAVWGAPPVPHPTMEVMVDEALSAAGQHRRVALHVSSMMLLPEVIEATDLLAVVPEKLARVSASRLALDAWPLPFKLERVDTSMLWHSRMHHEPAHKWLRAALRAIGKAVLA
jgi:DNA-binding transcriptional LysR family regulator